MSISLRPDHLVRYKDLARLFLKYARSDVVDQAGLDELDRDELDPGATGTAEELATDLERLGPTYIKLGQLLSTRADLLPPPYLEALSRLQDGVEPFGFAEVEQIVEEELGVRLSRAFAFFDNVPLASASLGQVHRATLRDGREVAVKVQRPGIRDSIRSDLEALTELAQFADKHTRAGRRYGFADLVAQFRTSILRELDYEQEARNLQTLGANLAGFDRIRVPQPILDFTTHRVLTMEFVGGRKLTSIGPLAQLELDGPVLADQLLGAYLKQILVDGFFHADPHPGNVFLTEDGHIALIDLGMVGRVPVATQERLLKLLLAVSEGRGDEVARELRALADQVEDTDDAAFRRAVGEIVAEHQGLAMAEISAGSVVLRLAKASADSGLRPPPELSMLGRALLALDEVTRTLDPHFEPDAAVQRHAAELLRQRMTEGTSQGNVVTSLLEAKEFVEQLPGRVNRVMDALAEGELKLNVRGIDERELMRGIQKLANRLTAGMVIAALIIGAAMLTQVYPVLATAFFVVAAGLGFLLLVSIWQSDRSTRHQRPRG